MLLTNNPSVQTSIDIRGPWPLITYKSEMPYIKITYLLFTFFEVPCKTRKLCYRKDYRAMHTI